MCDGGERVCERDSSMCGGVLHGVCVCHTVRVTTVGLKRG